MELIASLTPGACDDPMEALATPPASAAIVELRADLLPDIDPRAAVTACPLPILFTLRSDRDGGQGPSDPSQRRALLQAAREAGCALLDLEYDRDLGLLDEGGLDPQQMVASWHQGSAPRRDLLEVCQSLLATPARFIKVVPSATTLADLESVLRLHPRFNNMGSGSRRLIAFATGTVGIASRYLAPLLGPPVTYVAWERQAPAAPGQLTAEQLLAVVGHLQGPPQRLFGVIGGDVSRSLSPPLHAAGYRATGLPYLFIPVSVPEEDDLDQLFTCSDRGLFHRVGLDVGGWAVTTPYKEAAARAATLQAPRVKAAAAANTLILKPHQVIAENTDADGVVGALHSHGIDPAGRRTLVQGTGGAGRGAAVGLRLAGADVWLRGRDEARTRGVADRLGVAWCRSGELPGRPDILVNATPMGQRSDQGSPFTEGEVAHAAVVVDMVYADRPTPLAEITNASAATLVDGRQVLAHQGYAQFAAFTGKLPPKDVMLAAIAQS